MVEGFPLPCPVIEILPEECEALSKHLGLPLGETVPLLESLLRQCSWEGGWPYLSLAATNIKTHLWSIENGHHVDISRKALNAMFRVKVE